MLPTPISFAYRIEGEYAINIDYMRQEYRVSWSGNWRDSPDLTYFPLVDASVTPIPHGWEVEELWTKSYVFRCGADSHIRILDDNEGAFPVFKYGMDERQRRLIRDEFSILRYLASYGCPVVRVHPEPLVDNEGIFGFKMEELFEIDVASGKLYTEQITSSIKQIHQTGVIHNDLSPSNVMKNKEGRVTLIDFGHAGYLGNQIPPNKRAPHSKSDCYSVELDMNALKGLLDIYARNGCF